MNTTTILALIVAGTLVLIVGAFLWGTVLAPIETGLAPLRARWTPGPGIAGNILGGIAEGI